MVIGLSITACNLGHGYERLSTVIGVMILGRYKVKAFIVHQVHVTRS